MTGILVKSQFIQSSIHQYIFMYSAWLLISLCTKFSCIELYVSVVEYMLPHSSLFSVSWVCCALWLFYPLTCILDEPNCFLMGVRLKYSNNNRELWFFFLCKECRALITRHVLWRLIWVCTVCQYFFYWSSIGINSMALFVFLCSWLAVGYRQSGETCMSLYGISWTIFCYQNSLFGITPNCFLQRDVHKIDFDLQLKVIVQPSAFSYKYDIVIGKAWLHLKRTFQNEWDLICSYTEQKSFLLNVFCALKGTFKG